MKKWIAGLGIFLALSVGASGALAVGFGQVRNGANARGYFGAPNEWICQGANGDAVCDYCAQNSLCTGFVDTDGDGVCDNCRKNGPGAGFMDADGDGVCDHSAACARQCGVRRGRCAG